MSRSTHAVPARHQLLAVCVLAIGAVAAAPNDAEVDDDASTAADATAASADATTAPADASATTDATVGNVAPTPESSVPDGNEGDASDDGPQYVTPDGSLPPYSAGNVYQLLCVADPDETDFNFSTIAAPYADTAGCMAFNPMSEGHATARACLCQNCFALQQQCDALPGCQQIQKCGFDTGCNSPDTCYLIGGACATQIDNWGVGSVATALTQMLETCGQSASPACPVQ